MELKKANHIFSNRIFITGDPIIDHYNDFVMPGGVLNVINNISFFTDFFDKYLPLEDFINYFHPNYKKIYNFYSPLDKDIFAPLVVCSDYNKGFLTATSNIICSDLLIVDSKYNTISKTLLKNSKIKILKQTCTDYFDEDLFNYFDYIIFTSHNKNIKFYDSNKNLLNTFFVNDYKAINSIGAGDVFVAALAFSLFNYIDNLNLPVIFTGVEQAAYFASLSTLTPYTSNLKELNVYY